VQHFGSTNHSSHYYNSVNHSSGGNYPSEIASSIPQSREGGGVGGPNNSSFRVENRRARPKIIKNVNNICNIFIFQNNNNN